MNALVESLKRLYEKRDTNSITKEKIESLTSITEEEKLYILGEDTLIDKPQTIPIDVASLLK